MYNNKRSRNKGFGVIEIIISLGILTIIASAGVSVILQSLWANTTSGDHTQASFLAQEGVEALYSMKNQLWSLVANGTYGLDSSTGTWVLSGGFDTSGKFTREVTVSDALRDGSGNIVESVGVSDPDSKKITSRVHWQSKSGAQSDVSLVSYVTNWRKDIPPTPTTLPSSPTPTTPPPSPTPTSPAPPTPTTPPWVDPQEETIIALTGWKVDSQGNYAYVVYDGGSPDFFVVDVSNVAAPVVVGSVDLPGNPKNIAVSGNYAYVASSDNTREFQVVNISNPAIPALAASYNSPGNYDAQGIFVTATRAYLVKSDDGSFFEYEITVFNITDPLVPTVLGNRSLVGGTNYEVVVVGNYAYIATDKNDQELRIVNVANLPWNIFDLSMAGVYNISGGLSARTIAALGTTLILGCSNGHFYVFDISNPTVPVLRDSETSGSHVADIDTEPSLNYAFLARLSGNSEFEVYDISNPSAVSLVTSFNTSTSLVGISFEPTKNRAFGVSSTEFIVLKP